MVRYSRSLVVLSVTAALAVPATLSAQTAVPRPSSGGSSTSSGSSGGSSGGGSSSGGSVSSGESRTSPPPMPSFPTDSRRPSSSSGSSRSGGSSTRGGDSGGGDGYVGPGTTRTGVAAPRGGTYAGAGAGDSYVGSRSRGGRPVAGTAVERQYSATPNYNLYFPYDPFSPWGRWYPWYYGGFGYGYVSFDPWRYGTSRYSLYRYGAWYNPYDPWCYGVGYWLCDPWGGAATTSYGASGNPREDVDDDEPTGSVRLRVSPSTAKVYVDGVLVGTAADFAGLTGHLKLTVAEHLIEIKADGYQTFVPKIEVEAGKTTTIRATLKKQ
jgi:hypothetical protein